MNGAIQVLEEARTILQKTRITSVERRYVEQLILVAISELENIQRNAETAKPYWET